MSYGWKGINQGSNNLSCETGNSCKTGNFPVTQEARYWELNIENLLLNNEY